MAARLPWKCIAVALAGAMWGTACVIVPTAIVVQEGVHVPWFLALGPLLPVSEHLPVAVTVFVLAPAMYAATSAALWNADRSRRVAIAATLLYALFLAAPILGINGSFWSERENVYLDPEIERTAVAARDRPELFTTMLLGLAGWHGFAWWRLRRFWCSNERRPFTRWLATGVASALFGGVLTWYSLAFSVLAFFLASGPVVLLGLLIRSYPLDHYVWLATTAVTYGIIGALISASREHRGALGPALIAVGLFAIGTIITFGLKEAYAPGYLAGIPSYIAESARSNGALFFPVMAGLVAWQAFVVSSLWRAFLQSRDRQGAFLDDLGSTDAP